MEDDVTGLVFDHRSARSAEALGEKLEFLLKHVDVRKRIAERGARVAHERFSTERIARQYLADFAVFVQINMR